MTAAEFQARRALPTVLHLNGETLVLAELPTVNLRKLVFGASRRAGTLSYFEHAQPGVMLALIRELRRRPEWATLPDGATWKRLVHCCNRYDPPPCACGRPGLFIVNTDTYCRKCRDKAHLRRATQCRVLDQRAGDVERVVTEAERVIDRARRHHSATDPKRAHKSRK